MPRTAIIGGMKFYLRMHLCLLPLTVLLAACTVPAPRTTLTAIPLPTLVSTAAPHQRSTPIPTHTLTSTVLPTRTLTSTVPPTKTSLPTQTGTPTALPTYAILRGTVNVAQAICHYGPGKPYLYKYGVIHGNRLEVIRRVQPGNFLEVRAIGGDNPCWLNPQWLDITGDLSSVQPVRPEDVKLPFSPYYPSGLSSISAVRNGNRVTIGWAPYTLKAGDDSEQYPYLVEAWVCRDGQIVFEPVGSYQTSVTIEDQQGCAEPSHARAYAVEKHGYTPWVEIPWPQP